ncbi:hypothetical protein [Nocardia arthritidis]|uniref:hypothetical protein n=1 Tax=Nocardia arthritidis TaxID=228602 RepID=UPI000AB82028
MLRREITLLVADLARLSVRLVAAGLVARVPAGLRPVRLARVTTRLRATGVPAGLATTGVPAGLTTTGVPAGLATTGVTDRLPAALLAAAGLTVLGRGDRPWDRPRRDR